MAAPIPPMLNYSIVYNLLSTDVDQICVKIHCL